MPANNMGITTGRDAFATAHSRQELEQRILNLAGNDTDDGVARKYGLEDSSSFSLQAARVWARGASALSSVTSVGYRCFDERYLIYSSAILARNRDEICRHLIGRENRVLVTFRAIRESPWRHAFVADGAVTKEYVSSLDNSFVFPLYLYPAASASKPGQAELGVESSPWPVGPGGRRPNLNPAFIADLEKRLGMKFVPEMPDVGADQRVRPREGASRQGGTPLQFGPEDVFHYIYAIFHSPTYRSRYAEFLKIDFPRVPLTSDVNLFRALCEKGAELVALHLLESPALENPITGYPVKGSNVVEKGFPKYVAPGEPEPGTGKPLKAGRVYINAVAAMSSSPSANVAAALRRQKSGDVKSPLQGQYFEGVPPEVWNFHIGGYQVCEKWLKDRRGRTLSYDDTTHYQKIIVALKETIRLMAEIDAAIPKWPIE